MVRVYGGQMMHQWTSLVKEVEREGEGEAALSASIVL